MQISHHGEKLLLTIELGGACSKGKRRFRAISQEATGLRPWSPNKAQKANALLDSLDVH